ncbi:cyanophycinase [Pseudidiomarina sp. YC-516-91]|uniref:cyanophycinase n=1 Tax=Pseudidiomarina salilacus TaxID=3384452 RepID=UPI003984A51F
MFRSIVIFFTLLQSVSYVSANEAEVEHQLLLAGGALKTCSSMAPRNCSDAAWVDAETMRTGNRVTLDEKTIEPLFSDDLWPVMRSSVRDKVKKIINTIRDDSSKLSMSSSAFADAFRAADEELYRELSDAEWYRIIDHLQVPVTLPEQVNFAATENAYSRAIYQRFVAMAAAAAKERGATSRGPRILISTASSRDPFDAVDFYLAVFRQAGAAVDVEVRWLPLDAAIRSAQTADQCKRLESYRAEVLGSHQRARVYPAKHREQLAFCQDSEAARELLEWADGLFLNGGDQSLTVQAFRQPNGEPTSELELIQQRLAASTLVLGGTSAGTAVQSPQPMISNGSSRAALLDGAVAAPAPQVGCERDGTCLRGVSSDSLTYDALGGLATFAAGILDTHFSERGRQARLMRLAADTKTPFAVGVDETTALAVNVRNGAFEVVGERGVFFIEGATAADTAVAATVSYLSSGATGTLSRSGLDEVVFATDGHTVPSDDSADFLRDRTAIELLKRVCSGAEQIRESFDDAQLLIQVDAQSRFARSGTECQVHNVQMGFVY